MPTVFMMMKPCYVCGTQSRWPDIGSPGSYHGARDLDTRPSAAQRSSIYMWVQRCLKCGYCAPDIAQGDPAAKEVIKRPAYKQQLAHADFSETADSFLCRALILEEVGDYVEAGWASVYAAWVSDDNGFSESAAACRVRALTHFRKAQAEEMPFAASRSEEVRLLVDLLRRSNQFDEARKLAEVELALEHDEETGKVLQYQLDLVEDGDVGGHTIVEATED
jgi:hypothetical protein